MLPTAMKLCNKLLRIFAFLQAVHVAVVEICCKLFVRAASQQGLTTTSSTSFTHIHIVLEQKIVLG